jgi:hypothetical protein
MVLRVLTTTAFGYRNSALHRASCYGDFMALGEKLLEKKGKIAMGIITVEG